MPVKSVNELAHALSENERKELTERIQRSLSLGRKDQAPIFHASTSNEYREQMVKQGLTELGIIQRLLLWIRRILSGREESDLFVEYKVAELSKLTAGENLADPGSRTILANFAERIFRLYLHVVPLQSFFQELWGSDRHMRDAVQYVLRKKIPRARMTLFDFIQQDELEALFENAETKQGLRQELLNRLNNAIEAIPPDVFSAIEEGLLPLYYLKELCFYDFKKFFASFQVEVGDFGGRSPNFKPASIDPLLDELEHLYYALQTAKKGGTGDQIHAELYEHFQLRKNIGPEIEQPAANGELNPELMFMPPPPKEEASESHMSPEEVAQKVALETTTAESGLKTLRRQLKDLRKDIDACLDQSRLADVIRCFRGDPYYKFIAYVPSLNLRDFYYASIRMKLMEELDNEYPNLRKKVIDRLVLAAFKGPLKEFENYRKQPIGFNRSGLPGFRYVDSLAILYNYTSNSFVGYVRDMLRILIRILPGRGREGSSELAFHISGIESLYEKISAIDQAFSVEGEDGKTLSRIRMNMDKDLNQERVYRIFVAQKDKDTRPVLEEGLEHLRSLAEALDNVLQIPEEMIDERFAQLSGMVVQGGFHAKFSNIAREMKLVLRATRYQRLLEEELF